jgi:hypothetical protein
VRGQDLRIAREGRRRVSGLEALLSPIASTPQALAASPVPRPQCLAGLELAGELLHELVPIGADLAPVAHQADPAEQIPRDYKAVDARRTAPEWPFCSKNFSRAFT